MRNLYTISELYRKTKPRQEAGYCVENVLYRIRVYTGSYTERRPRIDIVNRIGS